MESASYYQNKLEALRRTIEGLDAVLVASVHLGTIFEKDVYKNAAIQKFEYSVELYWKMAKLYLSLVHGVDESSPKLEAVFKNFASWVNVKASGSYDRQETNIHQYGSPGDRMTPRL